VSGISKAGIGIVLVLTAVALALLVGIEYERSGGGSSRTTAPEEVQRVAVETVPVGRTSMPDHVISYGNLVPLRTVDIVPEAPGQIEKILFTDGQQVAAGTPLVVMNSRIAEAQVQASRAQAEADQQNLQRTQSLTKRGLDSTYSLEQAQSRAAVSAANLAIDQQKLQRQTLRAPFAGTLGTHLVDVGAVLNGGGKIVRLDDVSQLQIEFRVPGGIITRVTDGTPVHVTIPVGSKNLNIRGKLSFVDPAVSTDTRSVLLRAVIANPKDRLHPGLFVRVSVDLDLHENALVVPVAAVMRDLNAAYVYVVDDKQIAHRKAIETGLSNDTQVEVLSGLQAGEQVVTVGQFRLQDGDPVNVVTEPAAMKGSS
jgi:membrane fusion protein (multidrug efflux system)